MSFHPIKNFKKVLKQQETFSVVYLQLRKSSYKRDSAYLIEQSDLAACFLDPDKLVEDPGRLFLKGAADYIQGESICRIFNEKRLNELKSYLFRLRGINPRKQEIDVTEDTSLIPSDGWNSIKPGNEYTFSMLFIEFDNIAEFEKMYDHRNLKEALAVFRQYVENQIQPFNGKIWIWTDFGGLVLFPYNSKTCYPALSAFKLVLNKFIHDVEDSRFPNFISFRLAMHLGNIIYKTKSTGNIVSDSVNSIFHLGRRFTPAGDFTLTPEIYRRIPHKIKKFFVPAGTFEGREIYRMKKPIFPEKREL